MRLFEEHTGLRIFGVPNGCDFSRAFLDTLLQRMGDAPPESLARIEIFTNTLRAARRWEELLMATQARLLPQIRVITELGADPLLDPPASTGDSSLSHRLTMMQAVRALLQSGLSLAPQSASFDLAGSLQTLMDELDGEGVERSALNMLDVEDHSEHWRTALRFLQIIEDSKLSHSVMPLGSERRQRAVVEQLAADWAKEPPQHPVLVAGSTGSRGATALLMEAVTKLPQGAIILPGFDFDLPLGSWDALGDDREAAADHPQFGFAQLGRRIGFERGDVKPWSETISPASPERNRFISLAMRPAPVTDEWLNEGPSHEPAIDKASENLCLIEAPNERFEAAAIALALREAVEADQHAALITPDATLSRRVTAALSRWGIVPDDSAGVPLHLTPPAIFVDLVAQCAGARTATTDFLALLKHPLCASGWDRSLHLTYSRDLDAEKLRNIGPEINWPPLIEWAKEREADAWINWLHDLLSAFTPPPEATINDYLALHRQAVNALAAGPESGSYDEVWSKNAGEKTHEILEELRENAGAAGLVTWAEYRTILRNLMSSDTVRRDGFEPDKRVSIWGQLEARVQSADLVILGGLNEGVWPAIPSPDPWLSRKMRADLGLQLPERRIGLAAHDFQQAVSNGNVILSRALKLDNTPTVASRWVTRIENLMSGIGENGRNCLAQMKVRGARYVALAAALDQPEMAIPSEPRPCPAPPIAARPERISITQAETLIRDPFAIYARKILQLEPLLMVGRAGDARDRGIGFHKVMERFVRASVSDGALSQATLMGIAEDTLRELVPWPSQRRIWQARLGRVAEDFVGREAKRQEFATPRFFEHSGSIPILGLSRALVLSGTADRIDLCDDGTIAIYDYKTSIPTSNQGRIFSYQLELEAYMALKQGFEGLAASRASHLEFISLSKPGHSRVVDASPDGISGVWDEFLKLVAHFEDELNGYAARLRPMFEDMWGDYDHLARRGEWEDSADFESEALS